MKHSATLETKSLHIKKGGLEIAVYENGKRFGTVVVSNSSIAWWPKGAKVKRSAYFLNWKKFEEMMAATKSSKK